ncbi:eukaryotic translation initiation factor 5B-like [Helianthus annuus]|uniref:eukaryotic translation initiation factor 5B-like n=1 Tax=Helianthus annuus TaxID=4232 RepID=UPI000B903A64|nr:eukaryotic translation initiation factor 5B-like [Helianthus annuus]
MILDHAYPNLIRDEENDLLGLSHMDNDSIRALAKYHPKHPKPTKSAELFGAIKDGNYQDPDPENHEHWRNAEERKEKGYEEELKILKGFISKRSEWFVKEEKKKSRKTTPNVKSGEESSSHPKKKQKKASSMSLIDEPDEDVPATNVEKEQDVTAAENIIINEDLFTTDTDFVENVVQTVTSDIQKEKVIDDIEGDDVDKDTTSSSSSSDDEVVDEIERERRMREEAEKEKLIKKRKRQEQEDAPYVPSQEHVTESQSTPKVRRKTGGRKKTTPKIRISKKPQKVVQKKQPEVEHQKPPTPPRESTPPQSPIHQSPPRQPTPPQQSSSPRLPTPPNQPLPTPQPTPPPQQPFMSSQDIFGTPLLSQLQHGSSSRGLQTPQDNLLDVGEFDFANNSQVLKLEKKIENVIAENKRLAAENKKAADREKLLVNRVQELEKKVEADQSEIDILKVRVSELEEEKNRRDAQNEYFELKHKELNEAKRAKDHELYMLHKVVESMLGSSVEDKFEELQVAEVRAERQAEVERQMKDKGKGVEGSSAVPVLALVPSMFTENPEPISAVSGLFEDETHMHELIGDSSDEDGDENEENDEDEEDDFVFSASSHSSKGNDDDDAAGDSGFRVTEVANEKAVDDLMNDTVNEESSEASGKGESDKTQIVEHSEPLFLRLDVYREMLKDVNLEIPFDLEEDLESFDINKQKDYKYDYVEDADQDDRIEVEDCSDSEDVPEDTSKLPTLMEFFAAENREALRQKVTEAVNENVFENLKKDAETESQSNVEKEDRSKWFKDSNERKFKRPLKFFQRDRTISLGDIIS